MKIKTACALLLLLPCVLSAKPKAAKNAPEWIATPYQKYSSDDYFAAVGSGTAKTAAELRAVEQLAAVFGRDVSSARSAESSQSSVQSDAVSEIVQKSSLNQQVLIEVAQKDLIGIEIPETFFDERRNEWYALAVLNKRTTADLYASILQKHDEAIQMQLARAERLADSMEKLACLYKACQLARLSEQLFPRFFVISPEQCTKAREAAVSPEALSAKLDDCAANIPVAVFVQNDSNGIIQTACEETLRSLGMAVSPQGAKYALNVSITTAYRSVQNPATEFCEFTLTAQCADTAGTVLVPWQLAKRAGGKTAEMATQKAYALMAEKIRSDYKECFERYLFGDGK